MWARRCRPGRNPIRAIPFHLSRATCRPGKVVGDTKGAVFGGLVEARLRPSTKKVYLHVPIAISLCAQPCISLGGGSHFALYLDSDLFIVKALV
ncbi:hypothetical protein Tco_1447421 [Tanacetum coccineum]